jgi:hypothetical protein
MNGTGGGAKVQASGVRGRPPQPAQTEPKRPRICFPHDLGCEGGGPGTCNRRAPRARSAPWNRTARTRNCHKSLHYRRKSPTGRGRRGSEPSRRGPAPASGAASTSARPTHGSPCQLDAGRTVHPQRAIEPRRSPSCAAIKCIIRASPPIARGRANASRHLVRHASPLSFDTRGLKPASDAGNEGHRKHAAHDLDRQRRAGQRRRVRPRRGRWSQADLDRSSSTSNATELDPTPPSPPRGGGWRASHENGLARPSL